MRMRRAHHDRIGLIGQMAFVAVAALACHQPQVLLAAHRTADAAMVSAMRRGMRVVAVAGREHRLVLFEHDLVRKPASTFRDHAQTVAATGTRKSDAAVPPRIAARSADAKPAASISLIGSASAMANGRGGPHTTRAAPSASAT